MKLFAVAYETAGTTPVAMSLYTERDLLIEARRTAYLQRSKMRNPGKKLEDWMVTAVPYDKVELDHRIFMCIDTEYEGEDRLHFSNISEDMALNLLALGDIT